MRAAGPGRDGVQRRERPGQGTAGCPHLTVTAAAKREHPAAFASGGDKVNLDWRLHIPPPVMEHVRRYCLDEGRVELLSSILDLAAVQRFLRGGRAARPAMRRVLFGLYAACVLTCGDWLRNPLPSAPVQVRVTTRRESAAVP